MLKVRCALCEVEITDQNDANEHIIPNAIGGRKKIRGFICRNCNNVTGHQWDNVLAKQFETLCLLLGIRRGAGRIPSKRFKTTENEDVILHPDGSMTFARPHITRTKERIHITNIPKADARKYIRSLERKYPEGRLDVGEGSTYLSGLLHESWSLGGPQMGRSIVKSAFSLAVHCGVRPIECERAREYLLNRDGEPCFSYFYSRDILENRPDEVLFHCVLLRGDPVARKLVGYVELFGFLRMVVCLSDNYIGKEFERGYSIDPLIGKEIELVVDLEVESGCGSEEHGLEMDEDNFRRCINHALSIAYRNYYGRVQGRVVKEAVAHAIASVDLEEGEVLTSEHAARFTDLMMEVIGPFLIHSLGHRISDPNDFTSASPDT